MNKYLLLLSHAFLLAFLLAFSHGIMKWVSVQAHASYLQLLLTQWRFVFLGLTIYGLVLFYYILVLRSAPVSALYPVYTGLSVLFVMLIGRWFFNEPISIYQVSGAAFILAGIALMGKAV